FALGFEVAVLRGLADHFLRRSYRPVCIFSFDHDMKSVAPRDRDCAWFVQVGTKKGEWKREKERRRNESCRALASGPPGLRPCGSGAGAFGGPTLQVENPRCC